MSPATLFAIGNWPSKRKDLPGFTCQKWWWSYVAILNFRKVSIHIIHKCANQVTHIIFLRWLRLNYFILFFSDECDLILFDWEARRNMPVPFPQKSSLHWAPGNHLLGSVCLFLSCGWGFWTAVCTWEDETCKIYFTMLLMCFMFWDCFKYVFTMVHRFIGSCLKHRSVLKRRKQKSWSGHEWSQFPSGSQDFRAHINLTHATGRYSQGSQRTHLCPWDMSHLWSLENAQEKTTGLRVPCYDIYRT